MSLWSNCSQTRAFQVSALRQKLASLAGVIQRAMASSASSIFMSMPTIDVNDAVA